VIRIVGGLEGAALAAELGERATAIVVDALRSSVTLAAMLSAGAENIFACADMDTARKIAAREKDTLLAGERESKTPADFDLGNSPVEAVAAELKGRNIAFTSGNGAPILVACRGAARIVMGGPANAGAAAAATREALATGGEVIIIPAGDHGEECEEDSAAAALLAEVSGPDIDPEQEVMLARWRNRIVEAGLETIFRESAHGRELARLGFEEDLRVSARPDLFATLPEVKEFFSVDGATVARVGNGA